MDQITAAPVMPEGQIKVSAPAKVHYPNLNALRFFAASMVIMSHIEMLKHYDGLPSNGHYKWFDISHIAVLGVDLFYALSGFLITSLLLLEKKRFGRIAVKDFYIRRVLRIWPLYFLLLILSFFILPHIPFFDMPKWGDANAHLWPSFLLYLFFLPNLQLLLYGAIPYSGQAWSVGVEEQYYLFWPLVVNKCGTVEKLKKAILVLIGIYLAIKIFLILSPRFFPHNPFLTLMLHFFKGRFQIDCLLIGSYFACINNLGKMKLLFNKYVQIATYAAAIIMMLGAYDMKNFFWEINAVLYSIIIINLVNSKTSIINLDFKVLDYIGKISYGMYMYHFIIITIVMRMITTKSIFMYLLVFGLTIGVSALSYELFERKLLKLKERFARIKTQAAK